MELKPGYKQTEVGVIPSDWGLEHVEDFAQITTGGKNTQNRSDDGSYPFFVRSQTIERINSYSFDGEAVLTAGDGVGTGKVFHYINGKFDVHQRVYRITDFADRVNGQFFFRYFSENFYARIMQMTAKSSVDSVRMEMIAKMQVPVPSRTEQDAIAAVIGDVDMLLVALDARIAKQRDLKVGVVKQLLTGKIRLPGFGGEWETKRLGDHVTFIKNGVYSRAELGTNDCVKYLHYGDVHTTTDVFLHPQSAVMPTLAGDKAARLGRLTGGDLVFVDATEDLAGVGKSVEIANIGNAHVVAGLHTIAARFDKSVLADGFKAYLQFIPTFGKHLRSLAAGTKVFATNRVHIASAEFELPSVEEQAAIAAVLADMDQQLAALEQQRAKTALLKQGMMQELLTGRARLV